MRITVPVVCAVVLVACSSPTECWEQSRTIRIPFDDPYTSTLSSRLAGWVYEGFVCSSKPLKDASGNEIGTEYTCSKCD